MMWHVVIIIVYGLTALALAPRLLALRDLPTTLAFFAIWGRYLLAGLHEYTYPSVAAGLSTIALFTVFVAGCGLAMVPLRLYWRPYLLPFHAAMALVVLTGLVHGELRGMADAMLRWAFFLVVALLLFRAMQAFGIQAMLRLLLVLTLAPLSLQLLGAAVGIVDFHSYGNVYIGGYFHNGNFSQIIMTCLIITILIQWRWVIWQILLTLVCFNGILLADYRTTVLATLPILGVYFGTMVLRGAAPLLRPMLLGTLVTGGILAVATTVAALPERYTDILTVARQLGELLAKPAEHYTEAERDLFTGRIYVWAQYVQAWIDGSLLNYLFGFGPNAFDGQDFSNSPHSTVVSYLYEYGLVGLVVLTMIFLSQAVVALRVPENFMALRLVAGLAGFFVLNLTVVPLVMVEGIILFAILSAATWAYAEAGAEPAAATVAPKRLGDRWRRTKAMTEQA